MGKKKQRDVQDDEGGQLRHKIPLGRLIVGDAHPDDTAKGPSRKRKTKQCGFEEPAAAVNRPLRHHATERLTVGAMPISYHRFTVAGWR